MIDSLLRKPPRTAFKRLANKRSQIKASARRSSSGMLIQTKGQNNKPWLKSADFSQINIELLMQTQTHPFVWVSCGPWARLGRCGQRWSSARAPACGICPWLARRRYRGARPPLAGARPSRPHREARWRRCRPVEDTRGTAWGAEPSRRDNLGVTRNPFKSLWAFEVLCSFVCRFALFVLTIYFPTVP